LSQDGSRYQPFTSCSLAGATAPTTARAHKVPYFLDSFGNTPAALAFRSRRRTKKKLPRFTPRRLMTWHFLSPPGQLFTLSHGSHLSRKIKIKTIKPREQIRDVGPTIPD
jgi:hypothetical protein